MKQNALIAAVAAIFTLASCQKEVPVHERATDDLVFTAQIATDASKTTVDAATGKVAWEATDTITITDNAGTSAKYAVSEIDAEGKATFVKASEETSTLGDGPYTAVYGTNPEGTQNYSETAPALPMTAESETRSLMFEVTCGLMELNLKAYESIDSIKVSGYPQTKDAAYTDYTLKCAKAVDISTDTTKFFVALPAGTYHKIFIYGRNGAVCRKQNVTTGIDIAANHITPVSFKDTLRFGVQLWAGGPYWATTNIGAKTPTDYGEYYAWGEVETKTVYNETTYILSDGTTTTLTKYNFDSYYGRVDNKKALDKDDDVAYVKSRGSWRMPTDAEFQSLIDNCTWTWKTVNGVKGRMITGNTEGYKNKSIFLPTAGYRNDSSLSDTGSCGYYWSSSLVTDNPNYSWGLYFYSGTLLRTGITRRFGMSVRPVSDYSD